MFYVYGYFEPDCCEPFYIGKGTGRRAFNHICPSELNRQNTPFHSKLKSLINQGIKPEIHIYEENLTESEALDLEKKLIERFGRKEIGTGCLFNILEGGQHSFLSDQQKAKIAASWTQERKEKVSKEMQGNKKCVGRVSTRRKPVGRFYCGKLVKQYAFLRQVEVDGFHRAYVSKVLNGQKDQYTGYNWKYL